VRLATKLAVLSSAGALVLGMTVAVVAGDAVGRELRNDLRGRAVTASKQLALSVAGLVIEDSPLAVRRLLEGFKESDPDVRYLYVIGLDGEVQAHTFSGGFPVELVAANPLGEVASTGQRYLSVDGDPVMDVGYRLLTGSPAEIHVGLGETALEDAVMRLRLQIAALTLGVALLVSSGVVVMSRVFTRPLRHLAEAAEEFGRTSVFRHVPVESRDETAALTESFNSMGWTIQEQMRMTERLVEELQLGHAHLEDQVRARTVDLEESNRALQEANETKNRFLANTSHELRTPLNSIIGFSGIMLDGLAGELNEEQRRQLGMVNTSGRYLLQIIGDLLDLSKVEANRFHPDVRPTSIASLAEGVVDSMRPLAADKGLTLDCEWFTAVTMIECDERMLRQILINLLGNAVKFTATGSVTLRIERDGDRDLLFRVIDTGPGIAPEDLDAVFDEFSQGTQDGLVKPKGTGLGLALSRRLAGLLGGALEVESSVGRGSTFTLRLPCVPAID